MAFANRGGLAAAVEPKGAPKGVPSAPTNTEVAHARSAANAEHQSDDGRILDAFARYRARLANFIRRRVPDQGEAEDILQEVFYELVAAYRLFEPVEEASAWLFRVARNRITDFFRRKKPQPFADHAVRVEDGESLLFEDLLPSPDAGPEAAYARSVLLEEIEAALDELPPEQRAAFVAHELEGRSFKELAAQAGVSVNAMVLRKHHAVLQLRRRLQAIRDEFISR